MCVCDVLSLVQIFVTPWTVALQALLCMGFPRQEYWSGLPFPSPMDLPDPAMEPTALTSPALPSGFFTRSTINTYCMCVCVCECATACMGAWEHSYESQQRLRHEAMPKQGHGIHY